MYQTARDRVRAETTVKHSKFIAFCAPVLTEDEAETFVRSIKKQFSDATHAPYAYILGNQGEKYRASDDGEPSGTSGVPILEAVKKQKLTYTAVVVVRYFGGIKLGTGGLSRAYAEAAELSIRDSGRIVYQQCAIFSFSCDYGDISSVQNKTYAAGGKILSGDYGEGASFRIAIPFINKDSFFSALADATSGRAVPILIEEKYCALE